ncbi:DUF4097 domain-containing protein [Gemmatimonadota bacterium]
MKRMTMQNGMMLTAATILTIAASVPAMAQQSVDERRPATADGHVLITNISGSVKISGWDRNEVHVRGTLGEGTERLDFTSSGGTTRIEVVLPKGEEARRQQRIKGSDLEISLPAGSRVEVNTVSADITVSTVTGEVELDSVSGNIRVMNTPSRVRSESISGDIEIENAQTGTRANSVSGRISVARAVGSFDLGTISSDITVVGVNITDGSCSSLSGDIRLDATLSSGAEIDLESHSGTVEIIVPANVSAEFDITTFAGGIKNAFGQEPQQRSQVMPGRFLRFTNGTGDARITINSFSGAVVITKK